MIRPSATFFLTSFLLFSATFFTLKAEPVRSPEIMKTWDRSNLQKINNLNLQNLIPVTLKKNWTFLPGPPPVNWQNTRLNGRSFHLNHDLINLRSLLSDDEKNISEGIIYCELESKKDGIAQLGMGCDWWFEAWCNGILCNSTMDIGNGTGEYSPLNHPCFMPVRKGNNLLAVYVKGGAGGWTFACGTIPPTIPVLSLKPVLMWPDSDSMSIGFSTCGKIGAGVQFKEKNSKKWSTVWDHRHGQITQKEFHTVTLSNLKPGKEYVYRVIMIDPFKTELRTYSGEYSFKMPEKNCSDFSFFFTADLQLEKKIQQSILKKLLKATDASTCDFIVFGGDIGSAFDPENTIKNLFPLLPDQKPVVYVRGNHELRGTKSVLYHDYFAMPNGQSYGLFRFGSTAFMLLDSWEDKPAATPGHPYCKYNADEMFYQEEINYIKPLFQSEKWRNAEKRIVLCHSAPYSHAGTVIPDFLKKLTDEDLGGKNPKSRLNLWVTGHKHLPMRSIPGTDEITAAAEPVKPAYGGKNYVYPVITVGGPTKRSAIKTSAFRVDCSKKGIRVRSFDDKGSPLEDIFYENNGKIVVSKKLPHYTVEPLKKK